MSTFERFYASSLQQPVLLWCAAAVGLVIVLSRTSLTRSARAFCLGWSVVPFLDAWLTADDVAGIGALSPTTATVLSTTFVIVGDLRAFHFLEASTGDGEIPFDRPSVTRAVLWSFVVPLTTTAARTVLPEAPWKMRATFLVYEVAFLVLVTGRYLLRRRPDHAWGRSVLAYVLLYYALWALADVLILFAHADAGYLLRVVPNVLYYGGLLAAIGLLAPRPTRRA